MCTGSSNKAMAMSTVPNRQAGATMLEILVAIVIVAIGLLGLAGLQARLQLSDFEAYQRSQALLLLQDMSDRLSVNRSNAISYVTDTPLGTGDSEPASCSSLTGQALDACEWSNAIKGAAEVLSGNNVGTLVNARGCISNPATGQYVVSVVWQGTTPTIAPAVTCGSGSYDTGGSCTNDKCRRVVSMVVNVGSI